MHDLEELLDQANFALDEGRFEDALQNSEAALKLEPADLEALGLKAAALAELGRWEDADAVYEALIAREPDEPSWVLGAAEVMIRQPGDDSQRVAAGLQLLDKIRRRVERDERLHFEWLMLSAVGLDQQGELGEALAAVGRALKVFPDEPEARLEHAALLFELCRFPEARAQLEALAQQLPEDPWPHWYLGLLAEREGNEAIAQQLFTKASALDPEAFPLPTRVSEQDFDAALATAIERLPEHARAELGNVTIRVEPFPDEESLRSGEVTPTILGVFQGTPIDERSPIVAEDHRTASIVLYQRNLERFARTREELIEQIGITVLHEVGHLLGLDEDELYDRGLD